MNTLSASCCHFLTHPKDISDIHHKQRTICSAQILEIKCFIKKKMAHLTTFKCKYNS